MGTGFTIGYVTRDNFSDTPHIETKLHVDVKIYKIQTTIVGLRKNETPKDHDQNMVGNNVIDKDNCSSTRNTNTLRTKY